MDPYLVAYARRTNNYKEHVKAHIDPKYFNVSKNEIFRKYSYYSIQNNNKNDRDYEGSKEFSNNFQNNNNKQHNSINVDQWQWELDNFVGTDAKKSIVEQPYRQTFKNKFQIEQKIPLSHNHRRHQKLNKLNNKTEGSQIKNFRKDIKRKTRLECDEVIIIIFYNVFNLMPFMYNQS